jgi:hypothetical protein
MNFDEKIEKYFLFFDENEFAEGKTHEIMIVNERII